MTQERREDVIGLLDYLIDIRCGTYDTCTFVMRPAVVELSAVQSTHSHGDIILCSFLVLRAFFKKVSVNCTNYLS